MPALELVEVSEVRAEGVPLSVSDARILQGIRQASPYVEQQAEMPFHQVLYSTAPGGTPLILDGTGHDTLWLPKPLMGVIAVGERTVDATGTTYGTAFLPYTYEVYGLRDQGELDERSKPRIVLTDGTIFPKGQRNIYITGSFGWTELAPDPADLVPPFAEIDRAPADIRWALIMLVINDFAPLLGSASAQDDRLRRWIVSENTEGHSYSLDRLAMSGGRSGIRDVDRTLAWYRARRPRQARV